MLHTPIFRVFCPKCLEECRRKITLALQAFPTRNPEINRSGCRISSKNRTIKNQTVKLLCISSIGHSSCPICIRLHLSQSFLTHQQTSYHFRSFPSISFPVFLYFTVLFSSTSMYNRSCILLRFPRRRTYPNTPSRTSVPSHLIGALRQTYILYVSNLFNRRIRESGKTTQ